MKEHGCRRIETSLEQCKCCSHCCSNLRALTEKILPETLTDCDLEFLNLEDKRLRLPVALIFIYKMSTHAKEREDRQPRIKTEKKYEKR